MKKPSSSRKGLIVMGAFALSLLLAGGAALAVFWPDESRLPRKAVDLLADSKVAFVDGQFASAETKLRMVLAEAPKHLGVRLLLGRTLIELGKLKEARALYDAVHKDAPEQTETLLGLARCHEASREWSLAVACYRRVAEMRKDDARVYKLLGHAQVKAGDSMAALFSYRQSLKLQPGQEDVSQAMNEIGANRAAMATIPGQKRGGTPFDPMDDFMPQHGMGRQFDPSRPSPNVPDPLQGLPVPGRREPR